MTGIFRISMGDVVRGVVVAVLTAAIAWLLIVLNTPGFDFLSIDWQELLRVALVAGLGYLAKNFITDSEGKVAGVIG